jgi:hypothetical protein
VQRIAIWLFSTVAAVALLLSYRTSRPPSANAPAPTEGDVVVSGATYTSEGYRESLQAALDAI